jgi:hypothetical protein
MRAPRPRRCWRRRWRRSAISSIGGVLAAARSVPVGLVALAAVVVVLLLAWAVAYWLAWEPRWLPRWRHAMGEAGWRASATWSEFLDWLRLGR